MLYMGFGGPSGSGAQALLAKCVRRRHDRKAEMAAKRVVNCYVLGPRGCGKSSLARALAGGRAEERQAGRQAPQPASSPQQAASSSQRGGGEAAAASARAGAASSGRLASVGAVAGDEGRERVMVMTEIPEDVATEFVMLTRISGAGPGAAPPVASSMPDLAKCDVAAFLFDSSSVESFRQVIDRPPLISACPSALCLSNLSRAVHSVFSLPSPLFP